MTQFIRNAWYVAAWSKEVGRNLLARRILDEPVVLFRQKDGTPAALLDRCAHKLAPLSMGRLVDDVVQCGYHGMEYDCTGQCVRVPGQERIPKSAKVRSFPLVERYNAVPSPVSSFFSVAFPKGSRVLDVGAGSGRDLNALLLAGYDACGVEPSQALRDAALLAFPALAGRVSAGLLPHLENPAGAPFDGVLCSAVLMRIGS